MYIKSLISSLIYSTNIFNEHILYVRNCAKFKYINSINTVSATIVYKLIYAQHVGCNTHAIKYVNYRHTTLYHNSVHLV